MVRATSWLDLLLRDAGVEEFDRELRRRRADSAGPDDEAEQEEARRALALRERLTSQRRQTRELAALNDLARRLAGADDVDAVLGEVARQARQLLGVDMSYIVMAEDGRLRVRVTDGGLGHLTAGMEVFSPQGPASMVIDKAAPLMIRDLAEEPVAPVGVGIITADEAERLAAAVSRERLRGVLGVPLTQERGGVVGALMAVDRLPRTFAPQDISLLSGLAVHASIALRSARLLMRYRAQADRLAAVNAKLRSLDQALRAAVEVHDALMAVVAAGGGVDEVVEALAAALSAAVSVDRHPAGAVRDLWSSSPERESAVVEVDESGHQVSVPIRLPGKVGRLLAVFGTAPGAGELWAVERGALVVALAITNEEAVAEVGRRESEELLAALVHGRGGELAVHRRARRMHMDLSRSHTLAVVDAACAEAVDLRGRLRALTSSVRGLTGESGDVVLVLVPVSATARLQERLAALPSPAGTAVFTTVVPTEGEAVRRCLDRCRRGLTLLRALERSGVVDLAELTPYLELFGAVPAPVIGAFTAARLGPLAADDSPRAQELIRTAETYLSHGQHQVRTAASLQVHLNTVKQRLHRLETILGADWTAPDRLLETHLALRLAILVARLPPAAVEQSGPVVSEGVAVDQVRREVDSMSRTVD